MTPEQRIEKLERELKEIKNYTSNLGGSLEFKTLVKRYAGGSVGSSTKGAGTESQAVDESGSASYSVLSEPDGFDSATIDGVTHYYPYWL